MEREKRGIAADLARSLPKPLPAEQVEIWLTGDALARSHLGLQQLGITLIKHAGQRLPLVD